MKILKLFVFLFLFCCTAYAQDTTKVRLESMCGKFYMGTPEWQFKNDVKNGTVKIYLFGGIVSAIHKKELAFGKLYNIAFYDFGCVVPGNLDFHEKYNHMVFDYLNQNFGVVWQKDINKNVVGWKTWKNKEE